MKMKHSINNIRLYAYLIIVLVISTLVACTEASTPTPVSSPVEVEGTVDNDEVQSSYPSASVSVAAEGEIGDAYPYPSIINANDEEDAYPIIHSEPTIQSEPYPPPHSVEYEFQEPRFRIDVPQVESNLTVTGQAPPNLPIAIIDVTFNGVVLGSGVSDDNGNFSIDVSALQQGNRIGITFSELEPDKSFDDMAIYYFPYRGNGFMNIPNVGIFFDTTLVE